ncbi:MAG: patatin-like phospholipase family protein [Nostoc sp. LLA-1]|nr:patatin-like phospholipase family protein [Cyanocohniella sp. LLY]
MAEKHPHFEIGLVMAGAVSAGAYTSGVIDFLFEALDQWYLQKNSQQQQYGDDFSQWEIPPHDVLIKAMSGASAGAIVASLTASSLYGEMVPVIEDPKSKSVKNQLYTSWVQRIDISHFLKAHDLENPQSPVLSFLDSTILKDIAQDVLKREPLRAPRPYVADPLQIYLCVTNLRGVPYVIQAQTANANIPGHLMIKHADFMHFTIGQNKSLVNGAIALNPDKSDADNWQLLINAALASSAFPIGLAPQQLERDSINYYDNRLWEMLVCGGDANQSSKSGFRTIIPKKDLVSEGTYKFTSVDGGIISNEPIELVRAALRGNEQRNPQDARQAKRATLLIDPFPNDVNAVNPDNNLLSLVSRMFRSLVNQVRFKPDELMLAMEEDIYSRFLIAPERSDRPVDKPLACGSINAFGGFLSQDFRHHDYVLGRRNCQRFLQKHFVLSADNPLFNSWSETLKNNPKWQVSKAGETDTFLPIIPLVGSATKVVNLPLWPRYHQDNLKVLEQQIEKRMQVIIPRLINLSINDGFTRNVLNFLWFMKRGRLVRTVKSWIEDNLQKYGQL